MSLLTHATSRVTEKDLLAVPEPEWTDTWHPISHARCVNTLLKAVETFNLPIIKKEYSLSKDGAKAFGSWVVGKDTEDNIAQTLVWRNSLDKMFAFGIAAGTHAFVCSNLAFSGEFIEFRRHTSGMNDSELERVVSHGIEVIIPRMKQFQNWHTALHAQRLSETQVKAIAYEAIAEEVISKHKITDFNNLLFGENARYASNELFGFHGACTETFRELRMTNSEGRQTKLYNFINKRFNTLKTV